MFNYNAEKNTFSISFNMDVLAEDVTCAIDDTIEKFFGETAISFMDDNDYKALFNQLLDSIKR